MTTTELIEFLQKHQYGGATGRPREVYICVGDEIYDTEIADYSTGDGLVTELYITLAERNTDQSDRPATCDYCKHWHGLKRDGRYWCSKHSAYMETACGEGEWDE